MIYLEDNTIVSKNIVEDIAYHKLLSTIFREVGTALKLKKYAFFANFMDYLCLPFEPGLEEATNYNTKYICKLNLPKRVAELPSFLSCCGVFKRIIPNVMCIASLFPNGRI